MPWHWPSIAAAAAAGAVAGAGVVLLRRSQRPSDSAASGDRAGDANSTLISSDGGARQAQEGQNLLNLLYNIAEDQARKEGHVHRGITCNACNTSPLRGIRYKCANCMDYDVCESCQVDDHHNFTHVFIQIRIPIPPLANPRRTLLPPFYPGLSANASRLSWEQLRVLQQDTHFDQVELEALYLQFKSLSTHPGPDGGITWDVFQQCLGPLGNEKNLVAERIFVFFDRDRDEVINFSDLVSGLSVLVKGTQEERIVHAFRGYDIHNTGYISRDQLRQMFRAYFLVSLELVREVTKTFEEEMIANFNDEGENPVSATFTAPIPAGPERADSGDSGDSGDEDQNNDLDGRRSQRAQGEAGAAGEAALSNEERRQRRRAARPPRTPIKPARALGAPHSSVDGMGWVPPAQQNLAPMMETMCHDAVEEMVERAFASADLDGDGQLSFAEFKAWALTDSTMIAWFDSLGSVF